MNRRWTYGNRRWLSGLAIASVMLAPAALSRYRLAIVKPGSLSTPHAQILSNRSSANTCTSCHEPAGLFAVGSDIHGVDGGGDMTDRCMNCHSQTINPSLARTPHHLTIADLRERTRRVTDRLQIDPAMAAARLQTPISMSHCSDIACSVCHQEHHGDDPQLTAMTDVQCQSCHSVSFTSFSDGHPQWDDYPTIQGRSIAFDHRSHSSKHFPDRLDHGVAAAFDCRTCHRENSVGEPMAAVDYDTGCASCHDQSLRSATADGFTLLALPSLSNEAAKRIEHWPSSATGLLDPATTLISQWLVDGTSNDPVSLANERRQWLANFVSMGQNHGVDHLVDRGVAENTAAAIFSTLSPQIVESAMRRWFSTTPSVSSSGTSFDGSDALAGEDSLGPGDDLLLAETAGAGASLLDDSLLDESLLSGVSDDLATSSAAEIVSSTPTRFRPWDMLARGGWYHDDTTMAIRYAGGGHADPILTAMIESAVLSDHDAAKQWASETLATSCLRCHDGAAQRPVVWTTRPIANQSSAKFAHLPHLQIAKLADCQQCHEVNSEATGDGVSQFTTMKISNCASCHHTAAAGESCTLCHDYHQIFDGNDHFTSREFVTPANRSHQK